MTRRSPSGSSSRVSHTASCARPTTSRKGSRRSGKSARLASRALDCRFRPRPFVVDTNPSKGADMQYMCLIYDDEQVFQNLADDERNRVFGEYGAFTESIRESGSY